MSKSSRRIERKYQGPNYRSGRKTLPPPPAPPPLSQYLGFRGAWITFDDEVREFAERMIMQGAPPVAPQSSEQRGELTPMKKTRSTEEKSREEESRHKVTFQWSPHTMVGFKYGRRQDTRVFLLVKMECLCGWTATPAGRGRTTIQEHDKLRVVRHFLRVISGEKALWVRDI